ncbi:hypothetical protein E2C01_097454 [Portunus trituberculatus]|uniref:Uncharacterized protein n=1 Tax=Portunus trituberculatus TaxID=210409 RepID=A0A5B7KBG3_PORTR|nr:hypothetical protein [Portunus trituberculatus]
MEEEEVEVEVEIQKKYASGNERTKAGVPRGMTHRCYGQKSACPAILESVPAVWLASVPKFRIRLTLLLEIH